MDKKDIYEHLAQIYLDSSVKKHPKAHAFAPVIFRNLFVVSAVCIVTLIGTLIFTVSRRKSPYNSEVAMILAPDVLKIHFDFNPAKKEIYALNLNKLDLTGVEPTAHVLSVTDRDRPDAVTPGLTPEDLAKNAPEFRHGMVRVPRIMEE